MFCGYLHVLPCIISYLWFFCFLFCCCFFLYLVYSAGTCSKISVCHGISIAINTAKLRDIFGDEDGILLAVMVASTPREDGRVRSRVRGVAAIR